ncbi:Diphthamide biosynthesis protein 4 [Tolypocladium ophioglossoides CBS 100239]|uniref:Diphthamide biosynthesis protein 4 n=1 Tax=Tolypocladium ophioglossoides (strain CBS 100239) TaxID=1163406 RepID=A0A0L0NMH4_TOLOC|nr:Diphthamide biosynthesis protein 4 [Tolypocladium ophioglossoides CBS 100239]
MRPLPPAAAPPNNSSMASSSHLVQLAKTLPPPLQRFFARWPPAAILPAAEAKPTPHQEQRPNPFRFYKHPVTGKWQDPVFSQRRQAQLVQMAREHGVEELLPETTKATEYQLAHRVEHGLRVKGTGVGQKVKGHIHERHMIAKMEERRRAMLEMPKLIKAWKRFAFQLMAAPHLSPEDRPPEPATHYEVLGVNPSILNSSTHDPSTLIKRAYRRALLRNHPDKAASTTREPTPSSSSTSPQKSVYTIDQISQAFTVLSSPARRTAYDASLSPSRALPGSGAGAAIFQTGVENVDLDDLPFGNVEEHWYRSCRCGNDKGYSFGEADLMEVGNEGVLMVGCQDCSLWLRVHFAVIDDDEPREQTNAKS